MKRDYSSAGARSSQAMSCSYNQDYISSKGGIGIMSNSYGGYGSNRRFSNSSSASLGRLTNNYDFKKRNSSSNSISATTVLGETLSRVGSSSGIYGSSTLEKTFSPRCNSFSSSSKINDKGYTGLSNYGKYQSFQSIASKPISYGTDEANSRLFSNGHNTASTSGKNEREKRSAELNRAYDELYNKYKAQLSRKPMNGALNSSSLTSNYTPTTEQLSKTDAYKTTTTINSIGGGSIRNKSQAIDEIALKGLRDASGRSRALTRTEDLNHTNLLPNSSASVENKKPSVAILKELFSKNDSEGIVNKISPPSSIKSLPPTEEKNSLQQTSKRADRRARTIENLVTELGEQKTTTTMEDKELESANKLAKNDDRESEKLNAPIVLVTQPSMVSRSNSPNAQAVSSNNSDKGEESAEDEESVYSSYSSWDTNSDEEDEEEFESDWEYNASGTDDETTVARTLQLSPSTGYESDFELPSLDGPNRRKSVVNKDYLALPLPIFTASISCDGVDSWSSNSKSIEDDMSFVSDFDATGGVTCTLSLVQQAALRPSDEEFSDATYSYSSCSYSDTSESDEDEEATQQTSSQDEHDVEEESASSMEAESIHSMENEDGTSTKVSLQLAHPNEELTEEIPNTEIEVLDANESLFEQIESGIEHEANIEEQKEISRMHTYVKQTIEEGAQSELANKLTGVQKPKTDFAKKAVIQPMKSEKVKVTMTKEEPIVFENSKDKEEQDNTARITNKPEIQSQVVSTLVEEDKKESQKHPSTKYHKSAVSTAEEERLRAELLREEKEQERRKSRRAGTVNAMAQRFADEPILPVVITKEPITYKRSSRLEPKEDEKVQKRTFAPIQKPVDDGQFDKQMAELREQMRKGDKKIQSECKNISQGIVSRTDDAKLKAMESAHKGKLETVSSTFNRAEEEKIRIKEQKKVLEEGRKQKEQQQGKSSASARKLPSESTQTARPPQKSEVKPSKDAAENEQTGPKVIGSRKVHTLGEAKTPVGHSPVKHSPKDRDQHKTQGDSTKRKETADSSKTPGIVEKRRKTEELVKFSIPPLEDSQKQENNSDKENTGPRSGKVRKKRHTNRRKRPFIGNPQNHDIDAYLGLSNLDTFEKMDAYFQNNGSEKLQNQNKNGLKDCIKRIGIGHQKVWISELMDIDKIYKPSELRDIKLSV